MINGRIQKKPRRVVVVHWKNNAAAPIEVFSNLKNFCQTYPAFNYNTLNNYLSKNKTAFENDLVRVERKPVISAVGPGKQTPVTQRLVPVVKKVLLKDLNQDIEDLEYWLFKTVKERVSAVTDIILQSIKPGQRLDKSYVLRRIPQQ